MSASCPPGADATVGDKFYYLAGYGTLNDGKSDCKNNWGGLNLAMFTNREEYDAIMGMRYIMQQERDPSLICGVSSHNFLASFMEKALDHIPSNISFEHTSESVTWWVGKKSGNS